MGPTTPEQAPVIAWARVWPVVKPAMSKILRRGAWYPVLADDDPDKVSLRVGTRMVQTPRRILEIRPGRDKPGRFTVVVRTSSDPNPVWGTGADVGDKYAVCPGCNHRTELFARPEWMTCKACGHKGDIAWWETA